jgi:hypothetical protein
LNIAIVNLSELEELTYTLDCLKLIDDEIIDAKIDIFTNYNLDDKIENSYIRNLVALRLYDLTFQDINPRYIDIRYYSRSYKYNIAVDTDGTLKSAITTYLLSGRTAGFKKSGIIGYFISKFYDEIIVYDETKDKRALTFELLSKTFGFENSHKTIHSKKD